MLTTSLPGAARLHRASDVTDKASDDRRDIVLVNAPGGGAAIAWTWAENDMLATGEHRLYTRRLSPALEPRGPTVRLDTSADPAGECGNLEGRTSVCAAWVPGPATIGFSGAALLAAWPTWPYLVGRVVPPANWRS